MMEATIFYDVDGRRLLTESLAQTFDAPQLVYGAAPLWTITLFQDDPEAAEGVSPMDLTGVASWAAAVAQDRDLATDPMCRSLGESIRTVDAERGIVSVRLNAKTKSFLEAANGADYGIRAWFELWGFDDGGETVLRIDFPIQAIMCVDDGNGGDPVEFGRDPIDPARIQNLDASVLASGTIDKARLPELAPEDVPSLDASKIASGTFDVERIPDLDAAKIASGVFDKARLPALEPADVPSLDAAKIASGVFDVERIPDLDAAKIASGTFDKARLPELAAEDVPSLDASKIASGTFDVERIPDLDAAKIASGTFDAERIPDLDAAKIASGTIDKARLPELAPEDVPALDAAKIASGTIDKARLPELAPEDVPALDAAKIASGVFDKARLPELAPEDVPSLDAAKIASGTLDAARLPELAAEDVPSLDASKIASGTFDVERIPDLDAAKIASGVFDVERIPDLDAAKIASGVFDKARLPALEPADVPSLDAAKIASGTFDKARLPELAPEDVPALDAAKIASGVFDKARLPELAAEDVPSLDASKIASGTIDKARLPELAPEDVPSLDASKIASGTLDVGRIPNLSASKITSGTLTAARIPSLDAGIITSGIFSENRLPTNARSLRELVEASISSGYGKISGAVNLSFNYPCLRLAMSEAMIISNVNGGSDYRDLKLFSETYEGKTIWKSSDALYESPYWKSNDWGIPRYVMPDSYAIVSGNDDAFAGTYRFAGIQAYDVFNTAVYMREGDGEANRPILKCDRTGWVLTATNGTQFNTSNAYESKSGTSDDLSSPYSGTYSANGSYASAASMQVQFFNATSKSVYFVWSDSFASPYSGNPYCIFDSDGYAGDIFGRDFSFSRIDPVSVIAFSVPQLLHDSSDNPRFFEVMMRIDCSLSSIPIKLSVPNRFASFVVNGSSIPVSSTTNLANTTKWMRIIVEENDLNAFLDGWDQETAKAKVNLYVETLA